MLSVRPDKPVDRVLLDMLTHVAEAAGVLGLRYFVAGALARDLVLTHVHGIDVPRPTRDVDIGIAVKSWNQFSAMKAYLENTGAFTPSAEKVHRLHFGDGTPIDLLPFDGVVDQRAILRWPPELAIEMNLTGFDEAFATAVSVVLTQSLTVLVASIPGLALLKLVAWTDRRHETPKDAADLLVLMRRYGDAGNHERLYGEHQGMLEAAGFDIELAGAKLLGSDVRELSTRETHGRLAQAFAPRGVYDALVTHVSSSVTWTDSAKRVDAAETLLGPFFDGLGIIKS